MDDDGPPKKMWPLALLLLSTVSLSEALTKNFVNQSMPELRPMFVVNFDMASVICQHSADPSDLHMHDMSILCDGKTDCYSNPAMHDESFPYCEGHCNSTCSNRGACLFDGRKAQCYCNTGFHGPSCELTDTNECAEKRCHWMAHCQNTYGSYECTCFPGFEGDGFECTDIDECETGEAECPPHAEVHAERRSPRALRRRRRVCDSKMHDCEQGTFCQNTVGGFSCVSQCDLGYQLLNGRCVDVDECVEGRCDKRASCENLPGSFRCHCDEGFTGDGRSCIPLTDCSQDESICDRHAFCLGAFRTCICQAGYKGDGLTCEDENECEAKSNPCENQAGKRCVNIEGGYICCDEGTDGCRLHQRERRLLRRRLRSPCRVFQPNVSVHGGILGRPPGEVRGRQRERAAEKYVLAEEAVEKGGSSSKRTGGIVVTGGVDVDELKNKILVGGFEACDGGCPEDSECIGSACQCRKGFIGEPGSDCQDINECDILEDACADIEGGWCLNTVGSFHCCSPSSAVTDCIGLEISASPNGTARLRLTNPNATAVGEAQAELRRSQGAAESEEVGQRKTSSGGRIIIAKGRVGSEETGGDQWGIEITREEHENATEKEAVQKEYEIATRAPLVVELTSTSGSLLSSMRPLSHDGSGLTTVIPPPRTTEKVDAVITDIKKPREGLETNPDEGEDPDSLKTDAEEKVASGTYTPGATTEATKAPENGTSTTNAPTTVSLSGTSYETSTVTSILKPTTESSTSSSTEGSGFEPETTESSGAEPATIEEIPTTTISAAIGVLSSEHASSASTVLPTASSDSPAESATSPSLPTGSTVESTASSEAATEAVAYVITSTTASPDAPKVSTPESSTEVLSGSSESPSIPTEPTASSTRGTTSGSSESSASEEATASPVLPIEEATVFTTESSSNGSSSPEAPETIEGPELSTTPGNVDGSTTSSTSSTASPLSSSTESSAQSTGNTVPSTATSAEASKRRTTPPSTTEGGESTIGEPELSTTPGKVNASTTSSGESTSSTESPSSSSTSSEALETTTSATTADAVTSTQAATVSAASTESSSAAPQSTTTSVEPSSTSSSSEKTRVTHPEEEDEETTSPTPATTSSTVPSGSTESASSSTTAENGLEIVRGVGGQRTTVEAEGVRRKETSESSAAFSPTPTTIGAEEKSSTAPVESTTGSASTSAADVTEETTKKATSSIPAEGPEEITSPTAEIPSSSSSAPEAPTETDTTASSVSTSDTESTGSSAPPSTSSTQGATSPTVEVTTEAASPVASESTTPASPIEEESITEGSTTSTPADKDFHSTSTPQVEDASPTSQEVPKISEAPSASVEMTTSTPLAESEETSALFGGTTIDSEEETSSTPLVGLEIVKVTAAPTAESIETKTETTTEASTSEGSGESTEPASSTESSEEATTLLVGIAIVKLTPDRTPETEAPEAVTIGSTSSEVSSAPLPTESTPEVATAASTEFPATDSTDTSASTERPSPSSSEWSTPALTDALAATSPEPSTASTSESTSVDLSFEATTEEPITSNTVTPDAGTSDTEGSGVEESTTKAPTTSRVTLPEEEGEQSTTSSTSEASGGESSTDSILSSTSSQRPFITVSSSTEDSTPSPASLSASPTSTSSKKATPEGSGDLPETTSSTEVTSSMEETTTPGFGIEIVNVTPESSEAPSIADASTPTERPSTSIPTESSTRSTSTTPEASSAPSSSTETASESRPPTLGPYVPPMATESSEILKTTREETVAPLTATISSVATKDVFSLRTTTLAPEADRHNPATVFQRCITSNECGDDAYCERRSGLCRCSPGFRGSPLRGRCEDVNECALKLDDCHPTTRCHNYVGGYGCFCAVGYRKTVHGVCEVIDECAERNGTLCGPNAFCTNLEGSYSCQCDEGFVGDGYVCTSLEKRHCTQEEWVRSDCGRNHVCLVDGRGAIDCDTCKPGFTMKHGVCSDVNECESKELSGCHKDALCTNLMGGHVCKCQPGYQGDGYSCIDVDECTHNPCHPQATCINVPGAFLCRCPSGWAGDGLAECLNPLDGACERRSELCEGAAHAACLSVRLPPRGDLSAVCECLPNFRFDNASRQCEDVDECLEDRHSCDPATSQCVNTLGGFRCECAPGFEGVGDVCVDVDECQRGVSGCHPNAHCVNHIGSVGCHCAEGFTGDGVDCQPIERIVTDSSCSTEWEEICRSKNKTCHVDDEEVSQCGSCLIGYQPTDGKCLPVNGLGNCADTSKNNCDENAECIDVHPGRHFCSCKIGYIGDGMRCDDVDECSIRGICDPDATCHNTNGSFECHCNKGFSGNGFKCVQNNNIYGGPSCHLNPKMCHPNARCLLDGKCKCFNGYEGDGLTFCDPISSQQAVSLHCSPPNNSSCHPNAHCDTSKGACVCRVGFYGDGVTFCQRTDLDCSKDASICDPSALCDRASKRCRCRDGFIGDGATCAPDGLDCTSRPSICSESAECAGRRCRCLPGFTGDGSTCVTLEESPKGCERCGMDAECVDGVCRCAQGFSGNGVVCVPDPNDCRRFPKLCHGNGICNTTSGRCECRRGFLGDGVDCSEQKSCRIDPLVCHEDAECLPGGQCQCREGYYGNGVECRKALPSTISEPSSKGCAESCGAHSECANGVCRCHRGFVLHGDRGCVDVDECASGSHRCHAAAKCENTAGSYDCHCPEGFFADGKQCHQKHSVGDDLHILCLDDGIRLLFHNESFDGRVYVRGQNENPFCSKSFATVLPETERRFFHIPFHHCDFRMEPNDTILTTVIVQRHPMFVTVSADAYDLRCEYPVVERTLLSHYNVSEMPPEKTIVERGPQPRCALTVENEDEVTVDAAVVGQTIKLALSVSPNDSYSILPKNCKAVNLETGEQYILTDGAGCAVDTELFPEWTRTAPSLVKAAFRTFKWPDSSMIRFQCDCSACIGECPAVNCGRRRMAMMRRRMRMRFTREDDVDFEGVDARRSAFSSVLLVAEDEEERRAQRQMERWLSRGFAEERGDTVWSEEVVERICVDSRWIVFNAFSLLLCVALTAALFIVHKHSKSSFYDLKRRKHGADYASTCDNASSYLKF
ncbi:hypothetical protein QR680_013044 [Steinernema hermaphroditum]|uniref:Uncharacterized protein n=1 Tax=Steinernema hermaphroditum TaxID=289476 RepID=A0AA39I685_9BILA|nr:hypothetical protein QR680_013044 [Steinernema hermaphroditum]